MSNIKVDTEFWKEIGKDRYTGIQDFKDKHNLEESDVLAAGILECFNEKSSKTMSVVKSGNVGILKFEFSFSKTTKFYFSLHRQILFYAVIVLFFAVIPSAIYKVISSNKQIIVGNEKGILAFQQIALTDIKSLLPLRKAVEVGNDEPFIGRYTLKELPKNSVVKEEHLLDTKLSQQMNERVIMQLPLKIESSGSSVTVNSKISLLFSPNQATGKSTVADDIILLGIEKKGAHSVFTIALTAEQVKTVQDLLAVSTIYVIKK